MRYIAHIPLAGGFALGNMNIIGQPPVAITSYSPFESNDLLYRRYLKKKGYDVPYYVLDKLTDIEKQELSKLFGTIDFSSSVPPCSGLSQAAQRKKGTRGTAAPNDWMYESARFLIGDIGVTVYAFENAPGLFTGSGDLVREKLIEIGKEFGYSITFYKTNTLKHGIPQYRPRTYGIFYKGENAPILETYNRPYLNSLEYLKLIPKDTKHQDEYVHDEWDITKWEITKYLKQLLGENWRQEMVNFRPHITSYDYLGRKNLLNDFLEFQQSLPDKSDIVTKNIKHIIKNASEGRNARINYRVLGLDKEYIYAVIGEMMCRQVHPSEDRLMNIREHMHMMGLPHDYDLESPKEYVKITQNVPVKTCEDITTEIVEIIRGNRRLSPYSVLMQDNTKEVEIKKVKSLF
jgi:site-specific DNA-cytosine methylase